MTSSNVSTTWQQIINALADVTNDKTKFVSKEFLDDLEKEYIFNRLKTQASFGQFFVNKTGIYDVYLSFTSITDSPKTYDEQKDYIIKNYIKTKNYIK